MSSPLSSKDFKPVFICLGLGGFVFLWLVLSNYKFGYQSTTRVKQNPLRKQFQRQKKQQKQQGTLQLYLLQPKCDPLNSTDKMVPPSSLDRRDLLQSTRRIWNRGLESLPVVIDLPRLAKYVQVIDHRGGGGGGSYVPEKFSSHPLETNLDHEDLFFVLSSLVSALEADPQKTLLLLRHCLLEDSIECKEFSRYGEVQGLRWFLQKELGENSRTVHVLKAINQSIIAPAVTDLQMKLWEQLPFRDGGPNSWQVEVHIHDEFISISHSKLQRQLEVVQQDEHETKKTDAIVAEFQFRWRFEMTFNKHMNDMESVRLEITEFSTNDASHSERLNDLFEKCFSLVKH